MCTGYRSLSRVEALIIARRHSQPGHDGDGTKHLTVPKPGRPGVFRSGSVLAGCHDRRQLQIGGHFLTVGVWISQQRHTVDNDRDG